MRAQQTDVSQQGLWGSSKYRDVGAEPGSDLGSDPRSNLVVQGLIQNFDTPSTCGPSLSPCQ